MKCETVKLFIKQELTIILGHGFLSPPPDAVAPANTRSSELISLVSPYSV
jgi:hypothetical protein